MFATKIEINNIFINDVPVDRQCIIHHNYEGNKKKRSLCLRFRQKTFLFLASKSVHLKKIVFFALKSVTEFFL